jgi:hypothetical protein
MTTSSIEEIHRSINWSAADVNEQGTPGPRFHDVARVILAWHVGAPPGGAFWQTRKNVGSPHKSPHTEGFRREMRNELSA